MNLREGFTDLWKYPGRFGYTREYLRSTLENVQRYYNDITQPQLLLAPPPSNLSTELDKRALELNFDAQRYPCLLQASISHALKAVLVIEHDLPVVSTTLTEAQKTTNTRAVNFVMSLVREFWPAVADSRVQLQSTINQVSSLSSRKYGVHSAVQSHAALWKIFDDGLQKWVGEGGFMLNACQNPYALAELVKYVKQSIDGVKIAVMHAGLR